jgi:hypothetical protein
MARQACRKSSLLIKWLALRRRAKLVSPAAEAVKHQENYEQNRWEDEERQCCSN